MEPLEAIFIRVAKEGKDRKKYIFFKDQIDIAFLYASGFVDAKKYTYKEWVDSFEPCKQADGTYIVPHAQWIEKKKFHYNGPIRPPWDPMALEEREYSEKEIGEIIANKIIPCTVLDPGYAQVYVNNLKAQGRLVNGKARIDKGAKEFILQIINQYPSPMRVLEVSVYGLMRQKKGSRKASQEQLQKSGFKAGQTAQQIFTSRLADLAKSQPAKETPVQPPADKPAVSLKDLQKRRAPGKI